MQMEKLYDCFLTFDNFGYSSNRIIIYISLTIRAINNPFAHFAKNNYYILINHKVY